MPKFVMLSTLGPDGHARLRDSPERLREVNADVESMGVKVLEQFALLGQWDFLNILEAPDELTMAKVATTLAARGTLKTMTLTAIDVEDFIATMGGGVGSGPEA
ncbi:GYD domain-containing protein [Aquihabitans sp. G128]|uniref:GYD domain-containing protein n=1 Tax=Aquihabitans sp. G128 TaxID=2849779 RepID=UPI001C21F9ED|nr:GYD domain-containing protein [Aquihabitans sp. G128]QXC62868.1 GYD domain-containing protein [Aquihabitans sp. G128]